MTIPKNFGFNPLEDIQVLTTVQRSETRGKKLVVLVGTKKAVAMAVKRTEAQRRVTTLRQRLASSSGREVGPAGMPATVRP